MKRIICIIILFCFLTGCQNENINCDNNSCKVAVKIEIKKELPKT